MRKWTPEEREAQSRKLRAHHAKRRRGGVVITRPGRAPRPVDLTLSDLPQLLEAHQLVERIGWKLVRELAGRIAA